MLKSRHMSAFLFLAIASLATFSCLSSHEAPKEPVDSERPTENQQKLDEARAEMEIGRNMAGRLIKYYGAYPDEKLVRYVNEVGTLVSRYANYPDRKFMFEVYYSDDVNAFACPGGYILVSLGAIKNASNEAELAHVLGHEIAHVGKKHMYNALSKMNEDELKKTGEQSSKFNELTEEVRVRKRPTPEQSELGALVARYISGSSAGLNILQAAKAGMSLITEKGLGADLEYEADREGTKIATNAGYYSKGLVNFLCRIETRRGHASDYCLQKQATPEPSKSIMDRTHPSIPDRVLNIKEVLKAMKANEIVGAKGRKRYVAIKERIKGVTTNASDEERDTAEPTPEAKKD
jgi:predicted Zn-dependent protease